MNATVLFAYGCVSLLFVVLHYTEWRTIKLPRPRVRGPAPILAAARVVTWLR